MRLTDSDYAEIGEHNGVSAALAEMIVQDAIHKLGADRLACMTIVAAALDGAGLTHMTCNLGEATNQVRLALEGLTS